LQNTDFREKRPFSQKRQKLRKLWKKFFAKSDFCG
jgi:hypothetical protein